MLNEEKIRQMTGIAMFEKKEGKIIFPVNRKFRSDYLSVRLLVAFFSYTLCFGLCLLAWVLVKSDDLFAMASLDDLGFILFAGILLYLAGLFFYLLATWLVYQKRYDYASRGMDVYVAKLEKLLRRFGSAPYPEGDERGRRQS